ncbi:MAG: hypothetical protein QM790_13710 [Nibricoccus sp.]
MTPIKSLFATAAALLLTLSVHASAADPTGTWKWTQPGRNGGQGFEQTLKLDLKDGKLTGTMLGADTPRMKIPDVAIGDASFRDDAISFTVTREWNGNKIATKYEGKLEGDTIKGTSERPSRDGGAPQKRDWEAKRAKPAAPAAS